MDFFDVPDMETLMLSKLKNFVGDYEVKSLSSLLSSKMDCDCLVLACCSSVLEGVDMWFSDGDTRDVPRLVVYY
jgi:hypothetical protein